MADGRTLIPARDGYPLAATEHGDGDDAVVVAAGTGIRRTFYRRFADFLGESGLRAVTFDYRGIGGSRPDRLRGFDATMTDWATLDLAGVVDWVRRERDARRVSLVGHSFGGQALGLLPADARPDAAVFVNAQSGAWRTWPRARRPAMAALWHGAMPGLTRAFGYLPASRVSSMEDLPKGVALQWARWARHPDYILRDGHHAAYGDVRCPILAYSFTDDRWYAPRSAVDAFLWWFSGADVEHRHVDPHDVGLDAIGHFGFFRPEARDALWGSVAAWLRDPSSDDARAVRHEAATPTTARPAHRN